MKKVYISISIVVLLYIIIRIFAPTIADNKLNGLVNEPPYKVSLEAQKIYDDLPFIADLHCDALLWNRPMHKNLKRALVDLPKLQEAEVDLQVFTVVSKSPRGLNFDSNNDNTDDVTPLMFAQGRPINTWFSLKKRAGHMSKKLHQLEEHSKEEFTIVKTKKDLQNLIVSNQKGHKISGGLFGLEGAHPLEGKFENIQYMYDKGVRMIGLVHFFDNEVGGSVHGIEKGGLTDFGRKCIAEFERLNITIDLAHASETLIDDVVAIAKKPLVVSHTGVKGYCDRGRNLTDKHVQAVAASGGVIGIGFFDETLCGLEPRRIAESIEYVSNLVGIEHVALGSDYDGSVEVPFNITGFPIIVEELLKLDFSEEQIRKVMGENVRDLLLKNLPSQ